LLDLIDRVREATGKPVGFKAVIGAYGWLDNLFAAVNERGVESAPDIAGYGKKLAQVTDR